MTARPDGAGGRVNRHPRFRDERAPCPGVGNVTHLPTVDEAARMAAWSRLSEVAWSNLVLGRWHKGRWVDGMAPRWGWRVWHETDSRKSPQGLPDALLWRPPAGRDDRPTITAHLAATLERHGVTPTAQLLADLAGVGGACGLGEWLAVELKTETGALTVAQWSTLLEWRACGVEVHVWRPRDVADVEDRLRCR